MSFLFEKRYVKIKQEKEKLHMALIYIVEDDNNISEIESFALKNNRIF